MNLNFIKSVAPSDYRMALFGGTLFLMGLIHVVPVVLTAQNRMDTTVEDATVLNINRDAGFVKNITIEMLSVDSKITPRPAVMSGYRFTPNFSAGVGVGVHP